MEIKQVRKWVESKFEKVITKDLQAKIVDENSIFDIETYVNNLLDIYFDDNISFVEIKRETDLKYDFLFFDFENSTDDQTSLQDSFEFESNEFNNFSTEELLLNLISNSKEIRKKSIRALEIHAEDLIFQSSWGKIEEILEKHLTHSSDAEIQSLVLKVFQKLLKFSNKIQVLTKAFISTAKIFINYITLFNLEENTDYNKEHLHNNGLGSSKNFKFWQPEVLVKLMWLLINSQHQIPKKSMGFNEIKFNEIIFTFIHLLYSTSSENTKLSGLELLSVLNPTASWCSFWCHSATGRSLICSALRKYKSLLIYVIEIILKYIHTKKSYKLPPLPDKIILKFAAEHNDVCNPNSKLKWSNISNREKTNENNKFYSDISTSKHFNNISKTNRETGWIIETVPKELVNEAVFFHCLNFITCLIQFRSGRALFPIQTTIRKRLLNVQDFSLILIDFLENFEWKNGNTNTNNLHTSIYRAHINKILEILKNVKVHITSSRINAEKSNFLFKY